MNLSMGVVFLWLGAALYFLATHDLGATTPWGAFSALMGELRGDKMVARDDLVKAGARGVKTP